MRWQTTPTKRERERGEVKGIPREKRKERESYKEKEREREREKEREREDKRRRSVPFDCANFAKEIAKRESPTTRPSVDQPPFCLKKNNIK